MKFTESPVIEVSVLDTRLSIQQDNGSMHVVTSVWPCSLVLLKFAERWKSLESAGSSGENNSPYSHLLNFSNKRGVELGNGCGAAGMGLYLLGLHDIILTDIAPVMPALKRNKKALNKSLKTAQFYWGNEEQMKPLNPPFDFVIVADVVYLEETVAPLINSMEALMAANGVVLLGYQLRSPEAHKLFWEMCEEVFEVEHIRHEHLHPDYAYEDTDVYVFRKKTKLERENSRIQAYSRKKLLNSGAW